MLDTPTPQLAQEALSLLGVAIWLAPAFGVLMICWTMRELFQDLFQPSESGVLSSWMGRALFELARRIRFLLPVVGPLTIVAVIGCWTWILTIGFALIYWPAFPADFVDVRITSRAIGVLYFSLASLTTLATGNMAPKSDLLRLISALESLIGIALITASVTWIVMIYPALGRIRSLARWWHVVERAEGSLVERGGPVVLMELAQRVIRARVDLIHFPLIYYFHADTEGASLAYAFQGFLKMSRSARESEQNDIRFAAELLDSALQDVSEVLSCSFLKRERGADPETVFAAAARDHLLQS